MASGGVLHHQHHNGDIPHVHLSNNDVNSHGDSNVKLEQCDCAGDADDGSSRFYLHHHYPPGKKQERRHRSIGGSLHQLSKQGKVHRKTLAPDDGLNAEKPVGLRLVKSGVDIVRYSISTGDHAHIAETESRTNCGHELVAATCTKYWGTCEACRHPVHGTKYFYCRNCPAVCHNYRCCWKDLKRHCPAIEIGVEGWGEGMCHFSYLFDSTLN